MFRKFLLTAAVAVVVALVAPAVSQADFILEITVGSSFAKIDFNNSANDVNAGAFTVQTGAQPGTYTVSTLTGQNFGGYQINSTTAFNSFTGLQAIVENSTSTVANVTGTANSLTLTLIQTFVPVIDNAGISVTNTLSANSVYDGTITGQTSLTGATISGPPIATVSAPGGFDQTSASGAISGSATSLIVDNQVVINDLTQGLLTGSNNDIFQLKSKIEGTAGPFIQTPAPAGLILAATMVPFFGLLRRRLSRMAKETTVVA
jgi:hypothetical protein